MGKLKVWELFAGIGGFSVGLEKTEGFETEIFCEIEDFPQKVLKKNWPDVPIINDVKKVARWTWKKSKAQMLLRRVFLAKTYHSLEKVPGLPANVPVCGGKYAVPFAWYDHSSRCWRTWQLCLIEGWERYSEVWPRSGMTRNGIAYELPALDCHKIDPGHGLLPTPNARDGKDLSRTTRYLSARKRHTPSLATVLLEENLHWTLVANAYERVMGFPYNHTDIE